MAEKPRVLIIADDLTGAMDAAGPFASRGLSTWVAALPEDCDPSRFARATVVSVNTESRHLPPEEAARRVDHAFEQVGGDTFSIVVKKVDSTLRGNVVAESRAMMEVSDRRSALVCPAFPGQGRLVRAGTVYVHGQPLAETAFARDALSPALGEPLRDAFAGAGFGAVAVMDPADLDGADLSGQGAVIVNSETDADLDNVAAAGIRAAGRTLLVGSAGLTSALARMLADPEVQPEQPAVMGRIVYVVGSRAQASRDQAAEVVADGARLVEAVNGRLRNEPVLSPGADVVLMAVPDSQGKEGDAHEVAVMLSRHAMRLVGPGNAQAIVATGGDTAIAFLRTSGNPALVVGGELMPGIAYARFTIGTRPVWLVTKAGGFGDPGALRDIGRRLRAGAPAPA
ncbi:MAG: hypothetical protein GC151_04225 [Betaproteobacteria bacterium]|nr:hypothetical protein [Betaproteobacteria bacterium]